MRVRTSPWLLATIVLLLVTVTVSARRPRHHCKTHVRTTENPGGMTGGQIDSEQDSITTTAATPIEKIYIPSGAERLISAILDGNETSVRHLLKSGVPANATAVSAYSLPAIYMAARKGVLGVVQLLLDYEADVDSKSPVNGDTSLIIASENGHSDVVRLLLKHGADINARTRDRSGGSSALHVAAEEGHISVVQILVSHGIRIDERDSYGKTALLAATSDHLNIMQYLLDHNANVNIYDHEGTSALHFAALSRNLLAVQLLIKYNISINHDNDDGDSALDLATDFYHFQNNNEVVGLLLENGALLEGENEGRCPLHHNTYWLVRSTMKKMADRKCDPNVKDNVRGYTALHIVALKGLSTDFIDQLLAAGADIDIQDDTGRTPLISAAGRGHLEIVEFLLARNCNIELRDKDGETALFAATERNYFHIVEKLLEYGADPDARTNSMVPLHIAAKKNGNSSLLEALLRYNASMELRNINGYTPLLYAAWGCNIETARVLLEHGANVHATTNNGATILSVIDSYEHCRYFIKFLIQLNILSADDNMKAIERILDLSLQWRDVKMFEEFIDNSTNYSQHVDEYGYSPIHTAFLDNETAIAKILISCNHSTDSRDAKGRTLLHHSVRYHNLELTKLVLDHGADVNAQDQHGNSPLHDIRYEDIGELLFRERNSTIDIDIRNNDGRTPLHTAAASIFISQAVLLLDHGANVSVPDKAGNSPLHLAADHFYSQYSSDSAGYNNRVVSLLRRLIERNSVIDMKNNEGRTPLHMAALIDNGEIATVLLENGAQVHVRDNHGRTPLALALEEKKESVAEVLKFYNCTE